MGFRKICIFENGKLWSKDGRRLKDMPNGTEYRIRRSYHETSTSGWYDDCIDEELGQAFEKIGLDPELLDWVATPEGKYIFKKGVDDAPFAITHQERLAAIINPKVFLTEEFDLQGAAAGLGFKLCGVDDMHGKNFDKIIEKVKKVIK
jgi:hypothetical protein